ncbi:non-ribosomal peptide synthetase [[Kitasatospora] papulosa]|uniref:non-ribosomal peptide synthetase n=1 Tax=[Kitasatospora] papulosa TaxID=1464011 RepID=UPI002E3422D2|nr:non-ribosomal peptide synthetase [[Kitasatospora] papulosa]
MKISDLKLLSNDEQAELIALGRGAERLVPAEKTCADIFRELACASPDVSAVVVGDTRLTYRELDEWSDRVACDLSKNHGIGPDRVVALCFSPTVEMVVAVISIWKAGGAYVPLDPDLPDDRVRYMLRDTAAPVVLCGEEHRTRMEWLSTSSTGSPVRMLDGTWGRSGQSSGGSAPDVEGFDAGDLAYVIYTSGTTGTPKGVLIETRSLVNHVHVSRARYGLANPGEEVVLQLLNYAFDGGVYSMALALLTGNTLLLTGNQLWLHSARFTDYLNTHRVTHINGTPTLFKHLGLGEVLTLKRLVVGAETLDTAGYREMTRANPVPVFNEYGPTEATISTVSQVVREFDLAIGRPHDNAHVLVLDEALRPVPIGAVGEVFLAGPGLARGYLHQPKLTSERFIPNPFQTDVEKADQTYSQQGLNDRLYRTGDLARWRSDGVLDYVGRNDSQIKLRGFRVEVAEVEVVMGTFPSVVQSVVLPTTSGKQCEDSAEVDSLIGYYVAESPSDTTELRRHLELKLPSYMVPSALIHIPELPLTSNGKLDIQALRDLQPTAQGGSTEPRTELEAKLQALIAEIIGVEQQKVGLDDDLFRLGLNSLLVVKLISRLETDLNIEISLASLFTYVSITELVASPDFADAMPPSGSAPATG